MSTVLVTGASGFTGINLVPALLRQGVQVRVLARSVASREILGEMDCQCVAGDIRDRDALRHAMRGCDRVYHLAGLVPYWRSTEEEVYSVNAEGTRMVMQASLEAGVERVVHTSSTAAIGIPESGAIATEETLFDERSRRSWYSDSKRLAEEHVREAISKGLDAVIVNPGQVIGPGDRGMYMGNIVRFLKKGFVRAVTAGGMCMVDVDAVVAGLLAAAEKGRTGERYILGGENLSYMEIAGTVAEAVGRPPPRHVIPGWLLPPAALVVDALNAINRQSTTISGEHVRWGSDTLYYDSGKAIAELDYSIRPFREALFRAFDWYLENGYLD